MKQEVKAKQDNSRVADIVGTLVVLNRGNFVIDAGREFQEVVDGIIATNKPGELVIKLREQRRAVDLVPRQFVVFRDKAAQAFIKAYLELERSKKQAEDAARDRL